MALVLSLHLLHSPKAPLPYDPVVPASEHRVCYGGVGNGKDLIIDLVVGNEGALELGHGCAIAVKVTFQKESCLS